MQLPIFGARIHQTLAHFVHVDRIWLNDLLQDSIWIGKKNKTLNMKLYDG